MDGGAWKAAVHGVVEGWTQLSDFPFTFHFHALEKEMATRSSALAWRIPGTGEPGGLLSMGSHRVGHDGSDLVVVVVVKALSPLLRLETPQVPFDLLVVSRWHSHWTSGAARGLRCLGLGESSARSAVGHPWVSVCLLRNVPSLQAGGHGDHPSALPVPDTWLLL